MTQVMLAATFPKVVVNTTSGVVEVYSGVRDAHARAGLAAEEAARIAADDALQAAIEAEEAARIAADQALADDIAAEAAAREALDGALAPVAKSGVAADVAFTPAGGISTNDVQAAIEEAAAKSDMVASTYDPQGIVADTFDRSNHTGTQALATISDALVQLTYSRASKAALEATTVPGDVDEVRLRGYTTVGDGGGALYVRVGSEPDHPGKIQSADGAWWEIVPGDRLDIRATGAKLDGSTDDTAAIAAALAISKSIWIPNTGAAAMVDATALGLPNPAGGVPSERHRAFDLADHHDIEFEAGAKVEVIPNDSGQHAVFFGEEVTGVRIHGKGFLVGERDDHIGSTGTHGMGISLFSCSNCEIADLDISKFWGDGIYWGDEAATPNTDVRVINVHSHDNRRQGMTVVSAHRMLITGGSYSNTNGASPQGGLRLEPNNATQMIKDVTVIGVDFTGNAGGGLSTSGPMDLSERLTVVGCNFKDNQSGLSSKVPGTRVIGCSNDGSTSTTTHVGGFTISDGLISGCHSKNHNRTASGATDAGDVVVENCSSEYSGVDTKEDTFLFINKTGGSVSVRNCPQAHARAQVVRAQGSFDYMEIDGLTGWRHNTTGATVNPLRLAEATIAREVPIRNCRFPIPTGAKDDSIVVTLNEDTDYLVENCDVKGWDRTPTNWFLQGAGTGSVRWGAGNTLPSGVFGLPTSAWDGDHLVVGAYRLWVDGDGKLRIKSSAPTSATDGAVVGTQT